MEARHCAAMLVRCAHVLRGGARPTEARHLRVSVCVCMCVCVCVWLGGRWRYGDGRRMRERRGECGALLQQRRHSLRAIGRGSHSVRRSCCQCRQVPRSMRKQKSTHLWQIVNMRTGIQRTSKPQGQLTRVSHARVLHRLPGTRRSCYWLALRKEMVLILHHHNFYPLLQRRQHVCTKYFQLPCEFFLFGPCYGQHGNIDQQGAPGSSRNTGASFNNSSVSGG